jgi:hypothetical protein
MRSLIAATLLFVAGSCAHAACPAAISAKSGIPGHQSDWTTTYNLRNGTFEARHINGGIIRAAQKMATFRSRRFQEKSGRLMPSVGTIPTGNRPSQVTTFRRAALVG